MDLNEIEIEKEKKIEQAGHSFKFYHKSHEIVSVKEEKVAATLSNSYFQLEFKR